VTTIRRRHALPDHELALATERLGREPNETEEALLASMWSEHCGYKHSRALLRALPSETPGVLQGPGENAGVVAIGEGYAVAFKMESHNHPSAVEPFQGAATGVGGIIRDILAMGARPIACFDSLRFGPPDDPRSLRLLQGAVAGIAHYGNAVGVPTVGGEVAFDPAYADNCLVNVMCIGLMRAEDLRRSRAPEAGLNIVYAGSKTGRDGLGGAAFASADLSGDASADRPAVQVGDPFEEKLLIEATLEAIRRDLVLAVQDMGAAGITSATSELAHRSGLGIDLQTASVPRRETGMTPLEVVLSESQERMVFVPRPGCEDELAALLRRWELDAALIGQLVLGGRFRVLDGDRVAADLPVALLADAPVYTPPASPPPAAEPRSQDAPPVGDADAALTSLLAHPDICSRAAIYRRYDHMVLANTVVRPGDGDAAVLRVKGTRLGIAATTDCPARLVALDPHQGAVWTVAEAARNLACVGARPLAITDCLNFGNPERPESYWYLQEAIRGLADGARVFGLPVVSGNVSLYNESASSRVLPTPTVGMVGLLADASRHATTRFRREGDVVLLLGGPAASVEGSLYQRDLLGEPPASIPPLDLELELAVQDAIRNLVAEGLTDTAHDVSDGGLACALAEMAIGGGLGADLEIAPPGRPDAALFGEDAGRIVAAFPPGRLEDVKRVVERSGAPWCVLGTTGGARLTVRSGDLTVNHPVTWLAETWRQPMERWLGA
jgi:phosphoribosylformylglycinamidine synthase